jgi:hypothetical protein
MMPSICRIGVQYRTQISKKARSLFRPYKLSLDYFSPKSVKSSAHEYWFKTIDPPLLPVYPIYDKQKMAKSVRTKEDINQWRNDFETIFINSGQFLGN